jgi:hypothetical protein
MEPQSFYGHPKDKPLKKSMVRLEIDNPRCNALQLGSVIVGRGVSTVTVYEHEADYIVKQMVERDWADYEAAVRSFKNQVATEVRKRLDRTDSADDLLAARDRGTDQEVVKAFKEIEEVTGMSPEAIFYQLKQRSLLPLRSAKVIEGGIAEPQREESNAEQTKLAAVFASAMAAALQPLVAEIQQLKSQVIQQKR